MDLTTRYMGIELRNPLVVSACPLSEEIDTAKRFEDKGAAAIVVYSLFEEQINHEIHELDHFLAHGTESFAESLSYFPQPEAYRNLHAEEYFEHLRSLKEALGIPVIGSLNGVSAGGWMRYAKNIEEAGADAIELNVYYIATDAAKSADEVENMYIEDLKCVKEHVRIPVAVKLGPYFTSFANMAARFDLAGADGLVLFNRFYQPDIDLETLEPISNLELSAPYEMRLPLRWIAILYGKLRASLAANGGIHDAHSVIKMVLAGADVAEMASVLLREGPDKLASLIADMERWMGEKEYESVEQMKGSMSHRSVAQPEAYERANYIKMLQSFR